MSRHLVGLYIYIGFQSVLGLGFVFGVETTLRGALVVVLLSV